MREPSSGAAKSPAANRSAARANELTRRERTDDSTAPKSRKRTSASRPAVAAPLRNPGRSASSWAAERAKSTEPTSPNGALVTQKRPALTLMSRTSLAPGGTAALSARATAVSNVAATGP